MDEIELAALLASTLDWAVSHAESPAIKQVTSQGPTIRLLAIPGIPYRLTIEREPTHEAVVPGSVTGQDPLDGTMVDVVFRWTPGTPPAARTMADPMGTDDGSPDEFDIIAPPNLTCDQEDAVIEWLDTNWERPQ